jgi:hypothetical protein
MNMKATKRITESSNRIEDPDDPVTGDKEVMGAHESYLETLAQEAHERVEPDLTKAEASKRIGELRQKTGCDRSASQWRAPKTSRGVS